MVQDHYNEYENLRTEFCVQNPECQAVYRNIEYDENGVQVRFTFNWSWIDDSGELKRHNYDVEADEVISWIERTETLEGLDRSRVRFCMHMHDVYGNGEEFILVRSGYRYLSTDFTSMTVRECPAPFKRNDLLA